MPNRQKIKGFTLIELLVVIAIIALLLSILMPSLQMAKEIARRVICSNNLKSIGVGLHMYAQDYDEKMIPNAHFRGEEYVDGISPGYWPYQGYITGIDTSDPDFLMPLQLGKLFSMGYLVVPEVFYCPSTQISLEAKDIDYYTTGDLVKWMPPVKGGGWGAPLEVGGKIRCRSNYIYWTWTETLIMEVSTKPIVVDSLVRIAHKKRKKPFGINALFGDGHTSLTTIAHTPLIMELVNPDNTFDERGKDYDTFVKALKLLNP